MMMRNLLALMPLLLTKCVALSPSLKLSSLRRTSLPLCSTSSASNFDWSEAVDAAYLITCPNGDPGSYRLNRSKRILEDIGLSSAVKVREFATDDEDRVRGCYNSHIEILKEAKSTFDPEPPFSLPFLRQPGRDYRVLVLEDNISRSPRLSQETLDKLVSYSKTTSWDMLHLAYIMYVPGLTVTKTSPVDNGVVKLSTGVQSALGTTAYIISKRGVDRILEEHSQTGYTMAIPDLMAKLFPESRYAAYPMLFHRASKVKSLVNPQLDSLRELLFEPAIYTRVEQLLVASGLITNSLFVGLVATLFVASFASGGVVLDAIQHPGGQNIAVVGISGAFSLLSLAILAQGVLLAPPPPEATQGKGS